MALSKSYDPEELVFRGVESDELDYKAAMDWRTMSRAAKGKILRHLTAFANTRGGNLVIGVGENRSGVPELRTGVSAAQAASFDPTAVGNFINAHIEPPLDFSIDRPTVRGKRYVIFTVRPFASLPHVCSRGIDGELQEGVFYIRTVEASSRPARRVLEMQNLIRRCMRNEREQIGRILRGILYETKTLPEQPDRMNDLAEDAERYFRHRHPGSEDRVLAGFFLIPGGVPKRDREQRLAAVASAPMIRRGAAFLGADACRGGRSAPGSVRMLSGREPVMWQFFDSGPFLCFRFIEAAEFTLDFLARFTAEAVAFAGNLAAELCGGDELLTLRLSFSAPELAVVADGRRFAASGTSASAEIARSAADLVSGRENHAIRLVRRLGENFNLPDCRLDRLEPEIRDFMVRR